jgi:hypothetical protein
MGTALPSVVPHAHFSRHLVSFQAFVIFMIIASSSYGLSALPGGRRREMPVSGIVTFLARRKKTKAVSPA